MSVAREREWDEDLRESHRTCGKSVGNLKAKRTIELTLAQREKLRRWARKERGRVVWSRSTPRLDGVVGERWVRRGVCKERGHVVVVEVDAATRRSDGRGVGEETIV